MNYLALLFSLVALDLIVYVNCAKAWRNLDNVWWAVGGLTWLAVSTFFFVAFTFTWLILHVQFV